MKSRAIPFGLAALLVLGIPRVAPAADPAEPIAAALEFFENKVRPVLVEHCYQCHSQASEKLKGSLLVDSRAGLLSGGDSGPAVVPGKPDESLLIRAIRYRDKELQMPPKGKLPLEQIADLEAWVQMGVPYPGTESPVLGAKTGIDFDKARQFWSFRPVGDPAPPQVNDTSWPRSPLDHFILAKLEAKGLRPGPPADRRTLIRRVTFDLTGLPPTPEEVEAFLEDSAANAFEKVVDRLLASPHYGERWGRHWLDVVRYADTAGCNSDYPIPDMYRYRNWVIRAFNEDKPYPQFLREQLAGDLLAAELSEEQVEQRHALIIATGYLANSRRFASSKREFHLTIEDAIDNLGKAMLGLSISCARCHDHKFDPVSNRDYYALYGIFQSTRFAFPGCETVPVPEDLTPLADAEGAARLKEYEAEIIKLQQLISGYRAGRIGKELTSQERQKELRATTERLKEVAETRYPDVPKAYAVSDGRSADASIHRQGNPQSLGDKVPRGWLTILGGQTLPSEETGSGRRQLADWITDPNNPLTARVIVNRIWQYHFGKGIVPTPNDFGTRGERPTHPELLDYLASRFRESGYSIKAMHKLIMLTQAYQLASDHDPKNAEADPRNSYLWRFDRRRLEAEEIRDAMLAVAGTLDRTMGERQPFPPDAKIPTLKYSQHRPYIAGPDVFETKRRGIYLVQQRIKKQPFLETFDGADTNATTAVRTPSVTALQALTLVNSSFVHERSDEMAVRMSMAFDTAPARIRYAFQLALGRSPTPGEIEDGVSYLAAARRAYQGAGTPAEEAPRAALASYLRVLLTSNEFLYLD